MQPHVSLSLDLKDPLLCRRSSLSSWLSSTVSPLPTISPSSSDSSSSTAPDFSSSPSSQPSSSAITQCFLLIGPSLIRPSFSPLILLPSTPAIVTRFPLLGRPSFLPFPVPNSSSSSFDFSPIITSSVKTPFFRPRVSALDGDELARVSAVLHSDDDADSLEKLIGIDKGAIFARKASPPEVLAIAESAA